MIGIDLFSGAGGLSLGAQMMGIQIAIAIESDPHAVKTYGNYHKKTRIIEDDIRNIDIKKLTKYLPKSVDKIVFGGPPCQGFSFSNLKTRTSTNKNNWLFEEFFEFVRCIDPTWVVFENVRGFTNTEGGKFRRLAVERLETLGYSTWNDVLNAKDFGVPQDRARYFLVGNKKSVNFTPPQRISSKPVNVWEAIRDLPSLENGADFDRLKYRPVKPSEYAKQLRKDCSSTTNHSVTLNSSEVIERYKHVPPGGNWEAIPDSLMKNYKDRTRCHTGIYRRLRKDTPSVVIGNYRKNMLIHPSENRGLSVREAARLQSFPDDFEFFGSIGFQQQQVGNAVPPLLANHVFQAIVNSNG